MANVVPKPAGALNAHPPSDLLRRRRIGPGTVVELHNGHIVDVARGRIFDPGTRVFLRDGIILSPCRPEGASTAPKADLAVDLGGRFVLPGLFNTHCHVQLAFPAILAGLRELLLTRRLGKRQIAYALTDALDRGITHVRDGWSEDLRMNRRLTRRTALGRFSGPRIVPSVLVSPLGGSFAPDPRGLERALFSMGGIRPRAYEDPDSGVVAFPPEAPPSKVREAVDRAVEERGAKAIKIYDQRVKRLSFRPGAVLMSDGQLEAVADQARKRGVPTTMHQVTVESFRRGVRAGVSSLVHLPSDGPLDDHDLDASLRAGCVIEPTLSVAVHLCWPGLETDGSASPTLRALDAFRRRTMDAMAEEFWLPSMASGVLRGLRKGERGDFRIFGVLDGARAFRYRAGIASHGAENFRKLFDAGAIMACGNDAGGVPLSPAQVGLELALAELFLETTPGHRAFRPRDALAMATLHGARALGVEDRFGSIAPGKVADLVVVEGNPLEDIRVIGREAAAVFMEGRPVRNPAGLAVTEPGGRPPGRNQGGAALKSQPPNPSAE